MCKSKSEIDIDIEKMSAEQLKEEVRLQRSLKRTAIFLLGGLALCYRYKARRQESLLRTAAIMLATQDRQFERMGAK